MAVDARITELFCTTTITRNQNRSLSVSGYPCKKIRGLWLTSNEQQLSRSLLINHKFKIKNIVIRSILVMILLQEYGTILAAWIQRWFAWSFVLRNHGTYAIPILTWVWSEHPKLILRFCRNFGTYNPQFLRSFVETSTYTIRSLPGVSSKLRLIQPEVYSKFTRSFLEVYRCQSRSCDL